MSDPREDCPWKCKHCLCYEGEIKRLTTEDRVAKAIVDEQAEDEGLWFEARTAPEAYLQAALRRLHGAVEGKSQIECALNLVSGSQKP